jgi:serine acetyltransferase
MALFRHIVDGRRTGCDKQVIVYGNGPHTRVVQGYLFDQDPVAGYIVDDHVVHHQPRLGGHDVLPLSEALERFPPQHYAVLVALAFRDFNGLRKDRSDALRAMGYELVSFVDRSARLPQHFSIAANSIVLDHVAINDGVTVGEGVFVSSGAKVGHDSMLEDYCWVGSGVAMAGGVRVGAFSMLGLNCSIKQNTRLAHHTLVTPNTFVNADTQPYDAIASDAGKSLGVDSRKLMRFAYVGKPGADQ